MSTTAEKPQVAADLVTLEINGESVQVAKGSMIIQASDKAGIPVPRFCYHEKLPIAANCRMCWMLRKLRSQCLLAPHQ